MSNDNPTFIDYNGSKFWKNKKNQLHRIGGPAVDHFDGSKSWYVNDKLHRLDGPAMVWPSGNNQWYKNNVRFKNKEKFFEALTEAEKEIALFSEDFLNG
jgi:hypothetical protein